MSVAAAVVLALVALLTAIPAAAQPPVKLAAWACCVPTRQEPPL